MPGMQFPYPRKSSSAASTPYTSARGASYRQQKRALRAYGPPVLGVVAVLWFLIYLFGGGGPSRSGAGGGRRLAYGAPEVVIVTTIDPNMSPRLAESIMENRRDYAARHGYATFFPNTTDYDLGATSPSTWSTVPALRHALTLFPDSRWLWYLTATALIMNPRESLHAKVLEPRLLEKLMIVDRPVVPPDSVIKTFSHLRAERVDFVLTQDKDGLAGGSLLVRTGDWAKYFLDAWFDPLYRSYNFQKAEGHALEHIVQWHGTILAKLALVPQRLLNSYTREVPATAINGPDSLYQEGDFIANFHSCLRDKQRSCEAEMNPLISRWRELRDRDR